MTSYSKLALIAFVSLTAGARAGEALAGAAVPGEQPPAQTSYGRLPLHFEPNDGQTDPSVKFLARGSGYTLFLTSTESVLVLRRPGAAGSVVRMRLLGANPRPAVEGRGELPGKSNYFLGRDRNRWRTNVRQYARVEYQDVYPGVNLAYYGDQGQLEYDFVVSPGADPGSIRLGVQGADEMRIDADGNLVLRLRDGQLVQRAPVVYQEVDRARKVIDGRFVLKGKGEVGFKVGAYEASRPLVLDPVLVYSTYLGGSVRDFGYGIAVDRLGNAYVTGYALSSDFPTANALQAENAGSADAFVVKLNAAGSALVYSTYLGGSGEDAGIGIGVDAFGAAYIVGGTASTDFPTANALQVEFAGFPYDGFVTKLNAAGSALVYSTYLGGSDAENVIGIALDSSGNAYVTGYTLSTDFPTRIPLQPANAGSYDAFMSKLNAAGSALVYSTYLGGSGEDVAYGIALDGSRNAYVGGYTFSIDFPTRNPFQPENAGGTDAFVTRLNAEGSALVYSTYLGGSSFDSAAGIAVDGSRNAYVTGYTSSTTFPTRNPFQPKNAGDTDAFVTRLNAEGSGLVYSTYLGGSGFDFASGIAMDASRHAYVTGRTGSTNFPTRNPVQPENAGASDAFVTKLGTSTVGWSALVYSTYLGGNGLDIGRGIAVDTAGNAYVTGETSSTDFPTSKPFQAGNAGGSDAFVSKIGTPPLVRANEESAPLDRR